MALIDSNYVKTYFPLWQNYFVDDTGAASEAVLENEITLAEAEMLEHIEVAADTITDAQKVHLLNIIRKRGFDRRHGDTEFENEPQIIKAYNETMKHLKSYLPSAHDTMWAYEATKEMLKNEEDSSEDIRVTSKKRRFGEWFNSED